MTMAWVYEAPWYRGSDNWFLKNLVGNYTISGIYTIESPQYATVQSGLDSNLNFDSAGDRAIMNVNGASRTGSAVDAIDRLELTDTVCVVTRYFGGVKLGTGGLARAYGECAAGALKASEITERFISVAMKVSYGCELTGKVMSLIQKHACKIRKGDFQARTEIRLNVRKSLAERFRLDVINATSGKAVFSEDNPD